MTKTRQSLRTFLIRNQSLLILTLLSITSCSHGDIPKWGGKIWAGDSKKIGIARAQDAEFIAASDPAFDQYLAISYADFRSLFATYVQGCKTWKKGTQMMGSKEALDRFQILLLDLKRDAKAQEDEAQ